MNTTATNLDQRLQALRGAGMPPDDVWSRIEAEIQPRRRRQWPRWSALAAVICLSILAALLLRPAWLSGNPLSNPQLSLASLEQISISAQAQALDAHQAALNNAWPRVAQSAPAPLAAAISPQLNAVVQAREEVRQALQRHPDSAALLHQLADLDRWQHRLLRQLSHHLLPGIALEAQFRPNDLYWNWPSLYAVNQGRNAGATV
ncbi:MAG: hypothetical protein Tsb002_38250 [Wenzhouxiangellaceae bacterium]